MERRRRHRRGSRAGRAADHDAGGDPLGPRTGEVRRLRSLPPDVYRHAIAFADRLGLEPIVTFLHGHRAERLPEAFGLFVDPAAESRRFRNERDLDRLADDEQDGVVDALRSLVPDLAGHLALGPLPAAGLRLLS